MMQNHRSRAGQPAHGDAADARHVDEREGVEQHVPRPDLHRLITGARDGDPVIVAARYALGDACGAGGPADGEDIVGIDGVRRDMRGEGSFVAPGNGKVERVLGRIWTEGHQSDAVEQRRGDADMVASFDRRCADKGLGPDHADHPLQLMAAILHRRGADDRADLRRREIEYDELADVGQLDEQHIVLGDPRDDECARDPVDFGLKLGVGQPLRLAESEIAAVGCVDQRQPIGVRRRIGEEQVSECLVTPPATCPMPLPLILSCNDHLRRPARCFRPCRYRRRSPRPYACPNRCVRAG